MQTIQNGDFTIADNGGTLEIQDANNNVVLKYNPTKTQWEFPEAVELAAPVLSAASGNKIYDDVDDTLGGGSIDLDVAGGQVDSKDAIGVGDTSTDPAPGFGTWIEADANRPVFLLIEIDTETDGSQEAAIFIDVDESGGTTEDYAIECRTEDSTDGTRENETVSVLLPPGAQYRIRNVFDPKGLNSIQNVRQFTL